MWRTKLGALGLAIVGLVVVPAVAASATVVDSCTGVDHFPADPVEDAPSALTIALSVPSEFAGSTLTVTLDGPSGPVSATATVGPDGRVTVRLPLYEYGRHSITSVALSGEDEFGKYSTPLDPSTIAGGGIVDVGDGESTCDASNLTVAPPPAETVATTTTTTTTITTTTTTTVHEVVATAATVRSTSSTSTTTTTPATVDETPTQPTEGRNPAWLIPIGAGLLLAAAGGVLAARDDDDPCEDELAAWMAAQAECDRASAAAEASQAACDEAQSTVDGLEEQKRELCEQWPPACWGDGDGGWMEESGDPSSRITQRDLHMRKMALGEIWDDYQSGDLTAQEVEDAWNEANTPGFRDEMRERDAQAQAELGRIEGELATAQDQARQACEEAAGARAEAEAACARAAAAKAAYEACIGAASTPSSSSSSSGDDETDPPGEDPPISGGGGTGSGEEPPPSEPEPPGEEEDEDPLCCPKGLWAGYGWSTGGMLAVAGYESSILHFFCVNHPDRYVSMTSRSFRFGLGLGGETSVFGALMWDVFHASDVPRVWREKAASGFDFDVSLGAPITKGAKHLLSAGALKELARFLRFQAKSKVNPSELDPRKLENLMKMVNGVPLGTARSFPSQGASPQVVVFPLGPGLQVGAWWKAFADTETTDFRSCGCPWPP